MSLNADPVVQKVLLFYALLVSHIDRDCLAQQASGIPGRQLNMCGASHHKKTQDAKENHKTPEYL